MDKFGFKRVPGRNRVFVPRQHFKEFIELLCLVNCYRKRASLELVMKVVNREYIFESCSELYVRGVGEQELRKHPEEGQSFNR